jgi:hypothetical protein
MNRFRQRQHSIGDLTLDAINAASCGNSQAVQCLLEHYSGYMNKLASVKFYDDEGNVYTALDEFLRGFLDSLLIATTMKINLRLSG